MVTTTIHVWAISALLNMIIITIRQMEDPVTRDAFRSSLFRSVFLGPIWTGGLLLSLSGVLFRKS